MKEIKATRNEFNERLIEFAEYLESKRTRLHPHDDLRYLDMINIVTSPDGKQIEKPYNRLYHYWALALLPELYEQFYFLGEENELFYEAEEAYEDGASGAMIHFGLNDMKSFCSLFCISEKEGNDELTGHYGTNKLTKESSPDEIAKNIRLYVEYRQNNPIE